MFDETKYKTEFSKENYDKIGLVVPRGVKAELKEYADLNGISIGVLIRKAIREYTQIDTRMPTEK